MRKSVALVLGVLVPLLGLAGVGNAQSTVQVQGTIQAVDCQDQTLVVATPTSTNTIAVAPYTAVLVDSRAVSLCDLQQYVGSPATIWLVANGNEFIATRIDSTAQAYVAPAVLPAQQEAVAPLPLVGIVLGTILLAGLIYLLVRDGDHYYRYPYYGEYYRYYYRPAYRPYAGWYPVSCPVVYAAAPIGGVVLGITIFSGFDYLLVRDRDGRYERYPYYGPYRAYYYRPEYRAYAGSFRGDAPVRYGDTRGTTVYQRTDGTAPRYQPQPTYQPAPQYQRPYQQPSNYQYQQPQQYQRPTNYTPVPKETDRGSPPRYPQQPYQYQRPQQYQPPQYQGQPYGSPQPYQRNYTPVPQESDRGTTPRYQPPQQYQPQQRQYPQPQQYQPQQRQYPQPQQYQPQQRQYPQPQQYQPQQRQYQQPQQYQQYQRPQYAPVHNGDGGGSRGRDTRPVCQSNGQGQSCPDGTHNR